MRTIIRISVAGILISAIVPATGLAASALADVPTAPGGGVDTGYYPWSAFYGATTPKVHPERIHVKVLAGAALGWCPNLSWIYYEDAWYWTTFAGPNHHQVFHWEELPAETGDVFVVTGRHADIHNYEIWVGDGPANDWAYLGISTCGITPWDFPITEYINNGSLTIMVYYGPAANSYMNSSFVNVTPDF